MLSGVASYVSGGSPHPLANSTLTITSGPLSATVATAPDGSFSYPAPFGDEVGGDYTVSSAASAYLEAAQATAGANFLRLAQINSFSGTISADRVLRFSACAGVAAELADGALFGPLDYQYSKTPNGPWKTLGTGKLQINTNPCGIDGGAYPGKFTAPLANAYYRAYAPAVPAQMGLGQTSAVSQVIHLHRYPTRITGLTITPGRVSRDGKVTVSGRLWQQAGAWLPDPGQQVVLEFRYKNKTYTLKHRLTTDSAGRFRGVFAVPHTAAWHALYNGSRNDFATASKAITIHVR